MTDKRILFGDFEFPKADGLEYIWNEKQPVTDYLFVNEPNDSFSMYFEKGFPIFTVPENSDRPYCLFEWKRPGRSMKFFCPERHPNLDSVIWYFYMELLDDNGVAHGLPGQVRVGIEGFRFGPAKVKLKFIEVLKAVRLSQMAVTA